MATETLPEPDLIGKSIDEVDVDSLGWNRTRVWDAREPMFGDCEYDTERLNIHVDNQGIITRVDAG